MGVNKDIEKDILLEKVKEIFTNMFKTTTSSSILELYTNLLFEKDEQINHESK